MYSAKTCYPSIGEHCFPSCFLVTFPAKGIYYQIGSCPAYSLNLTKWHTQTEIELALQRKTAG